MSSRIPTKRSIYISENSKIKAIYPDQLLHNNDYTQIIGRLPFALVGGDHKISIDLTTFEEIEQFTEENYTMYNGRGEFVRTHMPKLKFAQTEDVIKFLLNKKRASKVDKNQEFLSSCSSLHFATVDNTFQVSSGFYPPAGESIEAYVRNKLLAHLLFLNRLPELSAEWKHHFVFNIHAASGHKSDVITKVGTEWREIYAKMKTGGGFEIPVEEYEKHRKVKYSSEVINRYHEIKLLMDLRDKFNLYLLAPYIE